MADRRSEILDAALHVLADHGMRGLTHRAVDTAAGLSPGSVSYYFRSRSALVAGCVDRLLQLDREVGRPVFTASAADLADVLTDVVVHSVLGAGRHHTLARYELSLAAARDPELRVAMRSGGATVRSWGAELLAANGVAEPERGASELIAVVDGLLFTALLQGPDDAVALAGWVRPVLVSVLAGHLG